MNTKQITLFFNTLGIAPNLKGYPYLVYLISLAASSNRWDAPKLQELYVRTGEHFNVPPEKIAGNIRTVLKKYWNQKNSSAFFEITHYRGEGSLPVKEFVYVVADYLVNHC